MITPSTDFRILKCPLELSQDHQLTFDNKTQQYNYFNSLSKIDFDDDFTYQRKDGTVRIPLPYDQALNYNYVMYKNAAYSDKWFYAFITGSEYLNDETTLLTVKTDTWQTWQFDLSFKRSFVEREHVSNDAIGANTVPENLEIGDYKIVDANYTTLYEGGDGYADWLPCFAVTDYPNNINAINQETKTIGSVFTSLHFFAVHDYDQARRLIRAYETAGDITSDAIVNVYMVPRSVVNINMENSNLASGGTPTNLGTSSTGSVFAYPLYDSWKSDEYYFTQNGFLADGYIPKNNKLYTYPYSYFYATNKVGEEVEYHWEDFPTVNGSKRVTYRKIIVPSTSISAKIYFTNYRGWSDDTYSTRLYNYGVNFAKVPVCAWTTDYYTNWLTQNGVNVATNLTSGVVSGLMQMATGVGAISGATSLMSTIGNTMGEIQRAKTTPPQAHGDTSTGDVIFAYAKNTISFYHMSIRSEYARICDEYFSRFGYKVTRNKVPALKSRYNWNYIKTIGCYIQASIPQEDLAEIKGFFDNGITLWHHANTFMDYAQNNPIV